MAPGPWGQPDSWIRPLRGKYQQLTRSRRAAPVRRVGTASRTKLEKGATRTHTRFLNEDDDDLRPVAGTVSSADHVPTPPDWPARKGRARKRRFADRGREGPGDRGPAGVPAERQVPASTPGPARPRPSPCGVPCPGPARASCTGLLGFLGSPVRQEDPGLRGRCRSWHPALWAGDLSGGLRLVNPGPRAGSPAGRQHPHKGRGPRPALGAPRMPYLQTRRARCTHRLGAGPVPTLVSS